MLVPHPLRCAPLTTVRMASATSTADCERGRCERTDSQAVGVCPWLDLVDSCSCLCRPRILQEWRLTPLS